MQILKVKTVELHVLYNACKAFTSKPAAGKGRKEGQAIDRMEGEIDLLKRLLTQWFGTLPLWALYRLPPWSETIFRAERLPLPTFHKAA